MGTRFYTTMVLYTIVHCCILVYCRHPGETCEEHQQSEMEMDAEFCPGCGVPTIRSDGCSEMICVCGTVRHC